MDLYTIGFLTGASFTGIIVLIVHMFGTDKIMTGKRSQENESGNDRKRSNHEQNDRNDQTKRVGT